MVILKGQTKAPFEKSFQALAAGYLPGQDIKIGGLNAIALLLGLVVAVLFIIGLLQSRKSKLKYGFEVVTFWIELIKIAIIVIAIGLLSISLADYNGYSYCTDTAYGSDTALYIYYTENHNRSPYLCSWRQRESCKTFRCKNSTCHVPSFTQIWVCSQPLQA